MSKTNDDFIRDYILSPAYGKDQAAYNKRFHHGSLSYQRNVFYSYSLAIAVKFWHKGTEYIAVSFDEHYSNTTSRHVSTLTYNIHRNYSSNQILPVYSVARIFDSDGTLMKQSFISDCNDDLDELRKEELWVLCSPWRRSRLESTIRTLRSLLIVDPDFDKCLTQFLEIYNKIDTVEKRDKLRREHEAEVRLREERAKEAMHNYVLDAEDILFDFMLLHTGALETADQRIRSLLDAVSTSSSDRLKDLMEDTTYVDVRSNIATDIGYYLEFSPPATANIRGCTIKFATGGASCHQGFTDAYSGSLTIMLSTLFTKYTEDGFDFESPWPNTIAGYAQTRLSKSSATFYPKNGGYGFSCQDNESANTFIPQAVFDLLHKFVETCRDRLGAIAYPDYKEDED